MSRKVAYPGRHFARRNAARLFGIAFGTPELMPSKSTTSFSSFATLMNTLF
jgi:hypothetical protein